MIQILLFLLIASFAQSLEDPNCGPDTFLNEMKICEVIVADMGVDMTGGEGAIIEFLILFVPIIVIVIFIIIIIKLIKKKNN